MVPRPRRGTIAPRGPPNTNQHSHESWTTNRGFAPPGAPDSVNFGLPGASGNYQNTVVTGNQSLLDNGANCPPGANTARQTAHGIQSGCA